MKYKTTKEFFDANYIYTDKAFPIMEELYEKYGENCFHYYMRGWDINHCFDLMQAIKLEIESDLLVTIEVQDEKIDEKIKLYELFPNSEFLFKNKDYAEYGILDVLEGNNWISIYKTFDNKTYPYSNFFIVKESYFLKGSEWDKCPKVIQKHFLDIKKGDKKEEN